MKRHYHILRHRCATVMTLALLLCHLAAVRLAAQDVVVTVTPVQQVLPPQLLLYLADPGKYFNVMLTNTSQEQQDVYLAMQLRQVMPASGLSISTPARRQSPKPFTIPAGGTRQLTMQEVKTLFNHVPSSEITASDGLFSNYSDGSFGLLPEGDYEAVLTAYKWSQPQLAAPVAVSSPASGTAHFTVCYKAQAPQFLAPISTSLELQDNSVADLDAISPLFTWTQPIIACNAAASTFRYNFKVVEVLQNQNLVEAVERNPVIYRSDNLLAAQCMIPTNVISSQMRTDRTYAAQVTALSAATGALNYVMLENDGKSSYRLFRIKTSDMPKAEEPQQTALPEQPKTEEEKDETIEVGFKWGDLELGGLIDPDSLYSFSLPQIIRPQFPEENGCRKAFMGNSISLEWIAPLHRGGTGDRPDTIKIEYDVEVFRGENVADLEATLATEPIYKHRTEETQDSIPWDDIKEMVEKGCYMVLRVNPVVVAGKSVAFMGDSTHIKDFALVEMLSKKFFQCSNMKDITNTTPTRLEAKELKGKTIDIGEYKLTIDEISKGKAENTWQGKGHVLWQPMGFKVHVCVEFDDLAINTDNQVYDGTAKGYSKPAEAALSDAQVVDKLFSDWGIDNLISETGIPYANQLQSQATGAVKDLAKRIDLSKYYGYVKKGQAILDDFLAGEVKDLYMPLSLPKSINVSPVDIQITSMKFAATYATMDLIGEFTLPNTSYTKNDILVFGAPRLCISPSRVLPESGTIALLSDFGIKDPKSGYEMTFKAPENVLEPDDGCYIAWHDDKLEMLGVDVDMIIPGLVKDINGMPSSTGEKPVFNVRASIGDWDDWMVDNVTIDPFQVSALPGWSFTASNIVYDHSFYRNSDKMGAFPAGYDKKKAGITGVVTDKDGQVYSVPGDKDWQGLYIKEIAVKFPKALEIGSSDDKRLSISASNMFFDKSGATLSVSTSKLLSAKTGSAGGWSFTLDKVYCNFLQSNFNDCGFSGTFAVPLLEGEIGYDCKIKKLKKDVDDSYAYVFKTQQVKDLSLDFMLAEATFDKDQTYFLLEATPNELGKLETNVELMLGGEMTIGGTEYLEKKAKSLPLKFKIPGLHFCGMRLSNQPNTWTATYEKEMQDKAKNAALSGKKLYSGKEFKFASGKVYFHTGQWSLASLQKKLGPFSFSLDNYNFDYQASNKKLVTTLEGTIKFIDGIELSASAGITINADVYVPTDVSKLNKIKFSYGSTDFNKLAIDSEFAGIKLAGSLEAVTGDTSKEGYSGNLNFTMPGDLFSVKAAGGYYKNKNEDYTYGFFWCTAASNLLRFDPVVINSITAGFYYNCKRKSDTECTPQKGLIGVMAGLELSTTAGEEALKGGIDMTVIYDKSSNRLSSFIFTGNVAAVSGLVNAKCNMVYENNSTDRYLQLDVTVDAKADETSLSEAMTKQSGELESLKKQLNNKYNSLVALAPKGTLAPLEEKEGTPNAPKQGTKPEVEVGAKIPLECKITWREKGTTYSKPNWHLYLGKPSFDDRCQFHLLKFKSSVLSVDIGADGYLCVGNELPDNGKLPPIPEDIRKFLNGGGDSKGIESADVSRANLARESSLKEFNDQIASIGGGVMFGARVWGYLDVDLGLFYLYAGADAGFDISVIKLPSNAYCTNISGQPGYKGWYGSGQLYAYLYARFGIRVNLGFWKKDFDVADAAIGGLFSFQGPKPSHFDGQARVKLRLADGLVNVNRKFSFSCGKGCDLFYGNALDNFELFGDLSIGYAERELGWKMSNSINPNLMEKPMLYTQAPLEQPFRVLDETEKERLKKNYDGDASDLDMQASRTFYFRSGASSSITVYEYSDSVSAYNNRNYTMHTWKIKGSDGTTSVIDMTQLNANRFYKMVVSGNAKEIQNGQEVDPVYYNEQTKKYENKAWSQSKTYYFRTGAVKEPGDCPDLQEYVAIAYPSHYNQLKSEKLFQVHEHDMMYPTIALKQDLSKTSFKKGKLYWCLYTIGGKLVSESPNAWSTTSNTCNMRPLENLKGYNYGTTYLMKLEYRTSKRHVLSGSKGGNVMIETKELMNLQVYVNKTRAGDWQSVTFDYEKPFVGARLDEVKFSRSDLDFRYVDNSYAYDDYKLDGFHLRRYDPYMYISYLSNYAFYGGWQFTADRIDVNVTTAQSLIYNDKGGVYEGSLGADCSSTTNIYNGLEKIKALSIYDRSQWSKYTEYPLPQLEDGVYSYVLTGLPRAHGYKASLIADERRVKEYLYDMLTPYVMAEELCEKIRTYAKQIDQLDADNKSFTDEANAMQKWYNDRVGSYCSVSYRNASLMVPAYQFPIVWGSMLNNADSQKKVTAWGTLKDYSTKAKKFPAARGHENNSEWVFSGLLGLDVKGDSMNDKNKHSWDYYKNVEKLLKHMESAKFSAYRCNAYDFVNCTYTVNNKLQGPQYIFSIDVEYPMEKIYKDK